MALYIRLAVDYQMDPKIMAAGPHAELLFLRGLAWSKQHATDGTVPTTALPLLALGLPEDGDELASRLVDQGAWEFAEDGYKAVSWEKWQTTNAQVDELRAKRAAAGRKGNAVRWGAKPQVNEGASQDAIDLRDKWDRKSSPDLRPTDLDLPLLVNPAGSTDPFADSFQECWDHYPRKQGRKEALRAYQARRRSGVLHHQLLTATRNYAQEVHGKDRQYVMHGKRFYGPNEVWVEYLTANKIDTTDMPEPGQVIER